MLVKEGYSFEIDCVIDKAPPGDKTAHGAKGSGDSKVDDKASKKAAQAAELLADSSFADLL